MFEHFSSHVSYITYVQHVKYVPHVSPVITLKFLEKNLTIVVIPAFGRKICCDHQNKLTYLIGTLSVESQCTPTRRFIDTPEDSSTMPMTILKLLAIYLHIEDAYSGAAHHGARNPAEVD